MRFEPGGHFIFGYHNSKDFFDRMEETIETGTVDESFTSFAFFSLTQLGNVMLEIGLELMGIFYEHTTK